MFWFCFAADFRAVSSRNYDMSVVRFQRRRRGQKDERIGEERTGSVSLTQQTAFDSDDWRWQREEEEGGREADGKELIHYASN